MSSFEVEPGDLIISRSGTVGEICTVPQGLGKTLISTNLLRVSLNQKVVLSQFFVFMFQGGGAVKSQVKELCKGSSREFLNQSILKSLVFPICSLQEQIQMIWEIDERLSLTDQLMRDIDSELAKSSEASPQTDEACVAYFDSDTPPALGRLVKRFDQQIQRLWEGHQLAA